MQNGRTQLAEYRTRIRLKQYELAELLGLHSAHLSQILSGKRRPGLDIATRIQDVTGIPATSWVDRRVGAAVRRPKPAAPKEPVGNELT